MERQLHLVREPGCIQPGKGENKQKTFFFSSDAAQTQPQDDRTMQSKMERQLHLVREPGCIQPGMALLLAGQSYYAAAVNASKTPSTELGCFLGSLRRKPHLVAFSWLILS